MFNVFRDLDTSSAALQHLSCASLSHSVAPLPRTPLVPSPRRPQTPSHHPDRFFRLQGLCASLPLTLFQFIRALRSARCMHRVVPALVVQR